MSEEVIAKYGKRWWLTDTMLIIEEPWGYTVYLLEVDKCFAKNVNIG